MKTDILGVHFHRCDNQKMAVDSIRVLRGGLKGRLVNVKFIGSLSNHGFKHLKKNSHKPGKFIHP